MLVRYLGPHDEITIPGGTCLRGDTVDVPDDLAVELVAREHGTAWELVPSTKAARAADKES